MNIKLSDFMQKFSPFVILGITIVLATTVLLLFSYLLFWGLVIGGLIWLGSLMKNYFFTPQTKPKNTGRIIEHEKERR